ncbi:unnamed protein product [Dracunculus medinensis]|uniref:Transmembrane protein n=1 Tax=Dracunculus medinensis TaxID=318479 RepID=A0A0N4UMI6_DRAME|nr:unnamed protein product [Dracunculus medinensis]
MSGVVPRSNTAIIQIKDQLVAIEMGNFHGKKKVKEVLDGKNDKFHTPEKFNGRTSRFLQNDPRSPSTTFVRTPIEVQRLHLVVFFILAFYFTWGNNLIYLV